MSRFVNKTPIPKERKCFRCRRYEKLPDDHLCFTCRTFLNNGYRKMDIADARKKEAQENYKKEMMEKEEW